MVQERRQPAVLGAWLCATILAATPASAQSPGDDAGGLRLTGAAQRGAFNVKEATASVRTSADPQAGDVLTLDFNIPKGTSAGTWAKAFPRPVDPATADIVRVAVRTRDPGHLAGLSAALEIKGSAGVQRIPLTLGLDWTPDELFVDWTQVGTLNEVVVSLERSGDGPPIVGSVDLDVRFELLTWGRRLSTSQGARAWSPTRTGAALTPASTTRGC